MLEDRLNGKQLETLAQLSPRKQAFVDRLAKQDLRLSSVLSIRGLLAGLVIAICLRTGLEAAWHGVATPVLDLFSRL